MYLEMSPKEVRNYLKPAVQLSAGVPLLQGLEKHNINPSMIGLVLADFRKHKPPLAVIARALMHKLGFSEESHLARTAQKVAELTTSKSREPAYHNIEHTVEATIMSYLIGSREPGLSKRDVALAVIAMLGHDAAHPGKGNQSPFQNEMRSFHAIAPALTELDKGEQAIIQEVILATDFENGVPDWRARYLGEHATEGDATRVAKIVNVCLDSDIAPSTSLSPAHSQLTSRLLSEEVGVASIARIDKQLDFLQHKRTGTFGRGNFIYEPASTQTQGSKAIGLPEQRKRVIAEFKRLQSIGVSVGPDLH